MPRPAPLAEAPRAESAVVTKALLRAAARLGIADNALARVIGVSPPTVSRMRRGAYALAQGQKPFELAVLFIRLYRSLDAIVGGDDAVASAWMRNANTVLAARPIELIQTVAGLVHVIEYLDSRRAIV